MQRLFSTFPSAWPGFGLLLLRCIAATALIAYANVGVWLSLEPTLLLMHGLTIITAMLLIGGLWTPVAGIAQALLQFYSNFPGVAAAAVEGRIAQRGGLARADGSNRSGAVRARNSSTPLRMTAPLYSPTRGSTSLP